MADRFIAPPESYTTLFGSALARLPGARHAAVRSWRERSFERFRELGFPGPKTEAWKYTPVASLVRNRFRLPEPGHFTREDLAALRFEGACNLVFIDGCFVSDLSDRLSAGSGVELVTLGAALEDGGADLLEALRAEEDETERGFSALNVAFASDGALIRARGSTTAPLHLIFAATSAPEPQLVSPHNLVLVEDGARLDLIESHATLGDAPQSLTNLDTLAIVGRGATLRHDRLQLGRPAGSLIGRTRYRLSADARLTQTVATSGGGLVRNEIEALIAGSGADLDLNGLYLGRGRQHLDTMIRVEHAAPGSESNQFYKGVLDERAHAVFAGKIVVQRPAQKTNAYQANNNLLLSSETEIDTKPELEIFADDVKCSHGATAGELDDHELFYLRSRGLDPELARSMLTYAFAGAVLERFADADVGRRVRRAVLDWLPGGDQLKELA